MKVLLELGKLQKWPIRAGGPFAKVQTLTVSRCVVVERYVEMPEFLSLSVFEVEPHRSLIKGAGYNGS